MRPVELFGLIDSLLAFIIAHVLILMNRGYHDTSAKFFIKLAKVIIPISGVLFFYWLFKIIF